MDTLPMSGGQGVASSNLASPTVKHLVRAHFPGKRNTALGSEEAVASSPFQMPSLEQPREHARRTVQLAGKVSDC